MIEVFSDSVTVATNAPIPLQSVSLVKGCAVKQQGTSTLIFNKAGVYEVNVDAVAISSVATTGSVSIQLAKNGVLQGVPSTESVDDVTSSHALSLNTLVQVPSDNCQCNCCSAPTVISVQNIGNAAILDINVVVTKVC